MRFGLGFIGLACLAASGGLAQTPVDIDRAIYVERTREGVRELEPATSLKAGDKVVLVVEWRAAAADRRFTVQSAVPRDLAFQRAGSEAVEVSTDGGRNWGELGDLKVGSRLASAEDVTHLRVRVAGAQRGRMTFSAVVR